MWFWLSVHVYSWPGILQSKYKRKSATPFPFRGHLRAYFTTRFLRHPLNGRYATCHAASQYQPLQGFTQYTPAEIVQVPAVLGVVVDPAVEDALVLVEAIALGFGAFGDCSKRHSRCCSDQCSSHFVCTAERLSSGSVTLWTTAKYSAASTALDLLRLLADVSACSTCTNRRLQHCNQRERAAASLRMQAFLVLIAGWGVRPPKGWRGRPRGWMQQGPAVPQFAVRKPMCSLAVLTNVSRND